MATKHEAQHKKKPRTVGGTAQKKARGAGGSGAGEKAKGQEYSRMAGLLKAKLK